MIAVSVTTVVQAAGSDELENASQFVAVEPDAVRAAGVELDAGCAGVIEPDQRTAAARTNLCWRTGRRIGRRVRSQRRQQRVSSVLVCRQRGERFYV